MKKYKQDVREVGFLGVVIGPDGIKMEEEKMKKVLDQPTPEEVKNIQKFLKLTNYYQQFIKDFAAIARLLYDLVKKIKSKIRQKQGEMFRELKNKKLVLAILDLD